MPRIAWTRPFDARETMVAMVEAAPFPVLQTGGFSANVDAVAWAPDTDPAAQRMRLWFVSLLGPQEAVRALWARLIAGETAVLTPADPTGARFCTLAPEGPRGWRFFTAGLRAVAGYHGVLVPDAARYTAERLDFLLLPQQHGEAAGLHYRFLNRRLDLPLHPWWAEWLWERALRTGEAVALESHGVRAYRCIPNADVLAADLGIAVRQGTLGIPVAAQNPTQTP